MGPFNEKEQEFWDDEFAFAIGDLLGSGYSRAYCRSAASDVIQVASSMARDAYEAGRADAEAEATTRRLRARVEEIRQKIIRHRATMTRKGF